MSQYSILAEGQGAHAEGKVSFPGSSSSRMIHAQGNGSYARGCVDASGAVKAAGKGSTAIGVGVTATDDYSTAIGKYSNDTDSTSFALRIGNGTSNTSRSNALTVDWNGNLVCNNIPAPPKEDGAYHLQCSVDSGLVMYEWIQDK